MNEHLFDLIENTNRNVFLTGRAGTGKTILITSHILSFIEELSDEILFILEGNIYFRGTPQQLLETTQKNNFQEAIAELLKNEKYD